MFPFEKYFVDFLGAILKILHILCILLDCCVPEGIEKNHSYFDNLLNYYHFTSFIHSVASMLKK